MKILTIIGMIVVVVGCCLIDRHLHLKTKGQEEGIYYWKKNKVKDWNTEEIPYRKRLWLEYLTKNK